MIDELSKVFAGFILILLSALLLLGIGAITVPEEQSNISYVIEERYWDEKLTMKSNYLSDDDGNRYLDEGNVDGTDVYFYYVLDEERAIERR